MAVDIFIGLIGFVVGWRHTLPVNGNVEGRSVRRISANGVVGFRNGPKQVCLGSKDWCSIVALFTEGPPERSSGARGFGQLEFRGWDARGSVTERSHAEA